MRVQTKILTNGQVDGLVREAEARGYRKGVEDAADAVELHETNWRVGPSENKVEVRAAILALLGQPGEANAMRKK